MSIEAPPTTGAVVLCGGDSRRMGHDKALLPFGQETMLGRVVRLLGEAVPPSNIVVVAGADQPLPNLPPAVPMVRDEQPGRGPLPAVIAGLRLLLSRGVDAAFVTACDFPLLKPEFARELLGRLPMPGAGADGPYHVVAPVDRQRIHPLAAAYACGCSAALEAAFTEATTAGGSGSLHAALSSPDIHLQRVAVDELRAVDPQLQSLHNCNTLEEYRWALAAAGLPPA